MAGSKEVFARRKQGKIDEAYELALELVEAPGAGEWEQSALAWCLIDLIKRESANRADARLEAYRAQLEAILPSADNEILATHRDKALALCRPEGRLLAEAKTVSQAGNAAQAVALYRKALAARPGDADIQTSLGWELYRHNKQLLTQDAPNVGLVRRNLSDYLMLAVGKPSPLHSCMLMQAAQLAGQDKLKMLAFSRLWNLDNLSGDDFEPYQTDDGKTLPALAEKVIRLAAKDVIASCNQDDLDYLQPYLEDAIDRFPDSLWLRHTKAKALLALNRHGEAMQFVVLVTKAKPDEFWTWELLGDVCAPSDPDAALACYCKGLTCSSDETFLGKLRLKLADALIAGQDFARAKCEVERVIVHRRESGHKIPEAAARITQQPWYAGTEPAASNHDYCKARAAHAEDVLLHDLPWTSAVTGERFTATTAEGKTRTRRRIYMASGDGMPKEVFVRESDFPFRDAGSGEPVQVKGESRPGDRYHVYKIERRAGADWDVVPTRVGVIDHVNKDKQLAHFIVARGIDGVIPLATLPGPVCEGNTVAVRMARFTSKKGDRYRVLSVEPSREQADAAVFRRFESTVSTSGDMGFTTDDIFIPPAVMKKAGVEDGEFVSGVALLNFDKKRMQWGWKAISASASEEP